MTEPNNANNGKIYNLRMPDPNNSRVAHTSLVTGSMNFLSSTFMNAGGYESPGITEPLVWISDEPGTREAAVLISSTILDVITVYTGVTGTPSITRSSRTDFTLTDTQGVQWLGIKKVGNNYNIYYGEILTSDSVYRFKKMVITPGVGSVDTLIDEIPLSPENGAWDVAQVKKVENIGHVSLVKTYPNKIYPYRFDIYIYSIDMDTEVISGGLTWSSGGTPTHWKSYMKDFSSQSLVSVVALTASMGVLHWATHYVDDASNTVGGTPLIFHVVADGVDTITLDTVSNDWIGSWSVDGFSKVCQYNTKDFLLVCEASRNPSNGLTHRDLIDTNGTVTTEFDPTTTIYNPTSSRLLPFISDFAFPGQPTTQFSIAGVTSIYNIFPNLDAFDGSIYLSVRKDAKDKIIGVNPYTMDITKTIEVTLPSASTLTSSTVKNSFNHGNFFVRWGIGGFSALQVYISYLFNLKSGLNQVQMIIEQN